MTSPTPTNDFIRAQKFETGAHADRLYTLQTPSSSSVLRNARRQHKSGVVSRLLHGHADGDPDTPNNT